MATAAVVLHVLVWAVFVRLSIGAVRHFTAGPGGRNPWSYLIALSFWAMAISTGPLEPSGRWWVVAGVAGFAGSLALFQWAARSTSGRHFSYVFTPDTPLFLHTAGPYAWIRNPFYSSYLLAYIASAIVFPGIVPTLIAAAMAMYFDIAARFEERKFEASALRAEYEQYRRRTGRFLPRIGVRRPD